VHLEQRLVSCSSHLRIRFGFRPGATKDTKHKGRNPARRWSDSNERLSRGIDSGGVEAAIKLLEICPGTKVVLVTESAPPKTLEQLAAQGYHFPALSAPLSREELHAVMFGDF
jgi:hypothetical protein